LSLHPSTRTASVIDTLPQALSVVYSNLEQITNNNNNNEECKISNKAFVSSTHFYSFQEENNTDAMQIMYVQDICIAVAFDHSLADRAYRLMQSICECDKG
jgi:hypothetical protein